LDGKAIPLRERVHRRQRSDRLRHLFKWCITTKSARTQFGLDRRHLNPAAGLAAPKFDHNRSRVMRSDERARLKPACYAYDWTFGSMIE
jgi:hypothetical protein